MATVRRVVTGEVDGEAVFAKVEAVDPIPGTTIYGAWGWDELPRLPLHPEGDYEHRSVFPPSTGVRVNVLEFPPGPADQTGPKPGDNRAWDDTLTAVPVHRERGADIVDLQDFAGHSDPRTTLTYIRNRDRLSRSPAYVLRY